MRIAIETPETLPNEDVEKIVDIRNRKSSRIIVIIMPINC